MTAQTLAAAADPRRWAAMAFVALAVSIIIMDATVVTVVLPVLIRDLELSAADAEWINAIYALVFAALLISAGRLGDSFGRRRLLLAGTVIFGIASLLAALAGNGAGLIGARLLQGVGGAMILPATLSTVNAMFTGRERGIAFAVWGGTIGGMAALGPLAGGWLTTALSWRWAFLINLPVVLVILAGVVAFVPETRDPAARRGTDPLGVLLSMLGLGAIVFGLIEGQRHGWWTTEAPLELGPFAWTLPLSPVPVAFAIGALALWAFFGLEHARRAAGRPVLVDLGLFRLRSFGFGSIAALVVALGEFGMLFTLPLFVQGTLAYSALDTGLLVLWLAIGAFLVSAILPPIARRLGGRDVVRLGLGLEIVAIVGLGLSLTPAAGFWGLAGWLFLYGMGVGFATAQLTSVILAEVPLRQSGEASGLQSTVRQLGSALGIALLGTLLVTSLGAAFADRLAGLAEVPETVRALAHDLVRASAGVAIPALAGLPGGDALVAAAREAMSAAARLTTFAAAGVILVGLVATAGLPALRDPHAD